MDRFSFSLVLIMIGLFIVPMGYMVNLLYGLGIITAIIGAAAVFSVSEEDGGREPTTEESRFFVVLLVLIMVLAVLGLWGLFALWLVDAILIVVYLAIRDD